MEFIVLNLITPALTGHLIGKRYKAAMDINQGLVEVRFVGGFLHGRRTYLANPEFRMRLLSRTGEVVCYCRRMVESFVIDGQELTAATYAPEGMADPEFERLVQLDAVRNGTPKVSLD